MKLVEQGAPPRSTVGGPSPVAFGDHRHAEQAYFWLSDGGRGPLAFDFGAEAHPSTLDQIGNCVYVVFDAKAQGRLISVQVLEEGLGRSPLWREVAGALIGPTLLGRLSTALTANQEVEEEGITIGQDEAAELREMWAVLHSSVAARLEIPNPPRRAPLPQVAAWLHVDRVVAMAQPAPADERLTVRHMRLPDGFALRLGIANTIELRRTESGLQVTARVEPSRTEDGKEPGVVVQLVEPKASPVVPLKMVDGYLRAILPEPNDLLPGELDFAALLVSHV